MGLANGRPPQLFVGDLPRAVARYLGCDPGAVYLSTAVMRKIVSKHVSDWEPLQFIPHIIWFGEYYRDPARNNCVTVIHTHPETNKLFLLGIKAAANGNEAWVQTIYRTDEKKLGAKRKAELLIYQNQAGALGMGTGRSPLAVGPA